MLQAVRTCYDAETKERRRKIGVIETKSSNQPNFSYRQKQKIDRTAGRQRKKIKRSGKQIKTAQTSVLNFSCQINIKNIE